MSNDLSVIDLHTHPGLKASLFGLSMRDQHRIAAGFAPKTMQVNARTLRAGGVKAFVNSTFIIERPMARDVWPITPASWFHRGLRHHLTGSVAQRTLEHLDLAERLAAEVKDGPRIRIARTFDELVAIEASGDIAMMHALEGAHHLGGDLSMVDKLSQRGVCMITLAHFYPNEAGGCFDLLSAIPRSFHKLGCCNARYQSDAGLTEWGTQLVERLFEVGIVADLVHAPPAYRQQVIALARCHHRPVIMSHALVHAIYPLDIYARPDEIRQIADTGGVIAVMASDHRPFHQAGARGIEMALENIAHLVREGGEDVVALGSDFDGFTSVPEDLRSPADYHSLREALLQRYSHTQVAKFLNGNARRALRDGWRSSNATARTAA